MGYTLYKSQAIRPLLFRMVLVSDHVTPATGLAPTVVLSKNGAGFASPAGAVTELANGVYQVAGHATDTNTLGPLLLHATAATADPAHEEYEVLTHTVGYAEGAVWVDTLAGTAGTVPFENGTADNPCHTFADAETIAAALGIRKFRIRAGSSIPLDQALHSAVLEGSNWQLTPNGQDLDGSSIKGAVITGIIAAGANPVHFEDCELGAAFLPPFVARRCSLRGAINLASAGEYFLLDCGDSVPEPNRPQFVCVNNCNLHLMNYNGDLDLASLRPSDVVEWSGRGRLRILAGATGGTVVLFGEHDITDQAGGVATVTSTASFAESRTADAILKRDWATVTGEAAHSVLNALRRLRNRVTRVGGTGTVMKEDGTTPAWTADITPSEIDPS